MSTIADLPVSAILLTGPGNEWAGSQDQATREETFTWTVPWADSNDFYAAVVGYPASISYGSASITRDIPLQHPFNPRLWATKLAWKGKDGTGKPAGAPFAWVLITVTFGYPGYSVDGGETAGQEGNSSGEVPFCRVSARSSGRTVTDTARQYSYTIGQVAGFKLKHDVGVYFSGRTFEITLFAIRDLGAWQTALAPLEGAINSQPFQIGAFTYQPGTVLFNGAGWDFDQDVLGNARWTGTVGVQTSALPWNSYFIGGQQVALTPPPYPNQQDFNVLYM